MRPRDLNSKTWTPENHWVEFSGDVEASLGWKTNDFSIQVMSGSIQSYICIPRHFWDQMVDWYMATCTDAWWRDWKNEESGMSEIDLGPVVDKWKDPHSKKTVHVKQWQLVASRTMYVSGKDSNICNIPRVSRSVIIRCNGPRNTHAGMFIQRERIERIIQWYMSEIKQQRRAA
jgi:hypothetical protein